MKLFLSPYFNPHDPEWAKLTDGLTAEAAGVWGHNLQLRQADLLALGEKGMTKLAKKRAKSPINPMNLFAAFEQEADMHKDEYEIWLHDLEQIDDSNNLAHALHDSGVLPNGDARLEALFRRAMRGNGYYSRLLQGYCEPAQVGTVIERGPSRSSALSLRSGDDGL